MNVYPVGVTIPVIINTEKADGTPITFSGSPTLGIRKGTASAVTTGLGALSVDAGGVTGAHTIEIDTTAGSGYYVAGETYYLVATAGTVDSVSMVGKVIYVFQLGPIGADVQAWDGGAVPTPAEAQAAATAALNAYDPPTKAEMDAAHALLATAAALATVDGIVDSIIEDTGTTIPVLIGSLHISQGAETCNYTVYDTDGATPLSGVKVEVTTNEDGSGHVTTGWTDAFGIVTFKLDPGTYYLWRSRFDRVFVNPDIEVVE